MMKRHPTSKNQGFALLLVMVYIFLAVVILTGVSTAVISSVRVTDTLDASRKALEAAEYGEVQTVMNLCEGKDACLGLAGWQKLNGQTPPDSAGVRRLPAFGETGVQPLTMAAAPGVEYVAVAVPSEVRKEDGLMIVYAAGRCGNAERRVEAVYRPASIGADTQSKHFSRISWRELPPSH